MRKIKGDKTAKGASWKTNNAQKCIENVFMKL